MLPYPIYTPTNKAKEGHDEHILTDDVIAEFGYKRERLALQLASMIANFAECHGLKLLDTKFEFSVLPDPDGTLVVVDEKGTPDASRFCDKTAF